MTAFNPNGANALFRFRITEAGTLVPVDGSDTVPGVSTDLLNRRAGPGTITIVNDPVAAAAGGPGLPVPMKLSDFLTLAKAIAVPQPVTGLPFSALNSAYAVSWQSLTGAAPGSVAPQAYVELVSPAPGRGMNF